MDPKQKQQGSQQPEETTPRGEKRAVCVISHAQFGHHFQGHHLPRNKPVIIEISPADFDEESRMPTPESALGQQIARHPGPPSLLEFIEDTDVRCIGGKNPNTGAETKAAERAKKIETVKVVGFSLHDRGHYRAHVYWPADAQAPVCYEVPARALRELEADKRLKILSPVKDEENPGKRIFVPPEQFHAISGAKYFQALAEQQREDADEESIYERVKAKKKAEDERRQRVTNANAT
jgi:hypothetical protein